MYILCDFPGPPDHSTDPLFPFTGAPGVICKNNIAEEKSRNHLYVVFFEQRTFNVK